MNSHIFDYFLVLTFRINFPTNSGYQEKFYFNPGDTGFKVGAWNNLNLNLICFIDLIFDDDFPSQLDFPLPFLNRFSKLNLQKLELVRGSIDF